MFLYSMEIQFVQINSQVDLMFLYCSVDDSLEKFVRLDLKVHTDSVITEMHMVIVSCFMLNTHSDTDIK